MKIYKCRYLCSYQIQMHDYCGVWDESVDKSRIPWDRCVSLKIKAQFPEILA